MLNNSLEERIKLTCKSYATVEDTTEEQDWVNGNETDIRIEFVEDATPSTNGSTITLPTGMSDDRLCNLLSALLHESFHIRFSDFTILKNRKLELLANPYLFHCFNALEDVRIDKKAIKLFPKSLLFHQVDICELIRTHKERLLNEPFPFQLLKAIVFRNFDIPLSNPVVIKALESPEFAKFLPAAQKAKNSKEILKLARELFFLLDKESGKQLSDLPIEAINDLLNKIKAQLDGQLDDIMGELVPINERIKELCGQLDGLRKENKGLHRKMSTNRTRARNRRNDATNLDRRGQHAEADHQNDLADRAEDRADEAEQKIGENDQKIADIENEIARLSKLKQALDKERQTVQNLQTDLMKNGIDSKAVRFGWSHLEVRGIQTLKQKNLKLPIYTFSPSMDDIIREVFLRKKESRVIDTEGNRLNRQGLHRLFTDSQNLFTSIINPYDERTQIAFLLDMSGSMLGSKMSIVNTAFAVLYSSLRNVFMQDNLNVDIGVWGFETELTKLKDFKEEKSAVEILTNYHPRGGTKIDDCLQDMTNIMKEFGYYQKRVVIMLTDAEDDNRSFINIKNTCNFEDCRVIFLGIENKDIPDAGKSLFLDIIHEESNTLKILTDALVRSVN